jgi:hypothetical protein
MAAVEASLPAATLPPQGSGVSYQQVTLVGDSVLLGAGPYLLRRLPAARVEAKVGRQGSDGLKLVKSLREQSQLGDAAVIHLGTNGYLGEQQFRGLLEQLADRKTVVVLNVYGARRWIGPNNALIARVSESFDNVRLVDWHAIGQNNPAYFVQDGIHLSGSGIHAYYHQIRIALGQPEVMLTGPSLRQLKRPELPLPSRPTMGSPDGPPTPSPASSTELYAAPMTSPMNGTDKPAASASSSSPSVSPPDQPGSPEN